MLTTLNAGALKGAPPLTTNERHGMEYVALRNFVLKGRGVVMAGETVEIPRHEVSFLLGSGRIAPIEEAAEEAPVDLTTLKKDELLALAAERGVKADSTMKKDDIIALLQFEV